MGPIELGPPTAHIAAQPQPVPREVPDVCWNLTWPGLNSEAEKSFLAQKAQWANGGMWSEAAQTSNRMSGRAEKAAHPAGPSAGQHCRGRLVCHSMLSRWLGKWVGSDILRAMTSRTKSSSCLVTSSAPQGSTVGPVLLHVRDRSDGTEGQQVWGCY